MNRLSKLFSRRKAPEKKQRIRFLASSCLEDSDLFLESENFIITGDVKKVSSGRPYQNVFKKGERILIAHFDTKTRKPASVRESLLLLKKFVSLFTELKRQGYAGFVGDTSNSAIVSFFRKRGAQIIQPTLLERVRVKYRYLAGVHDWDYPEKYLRRPVLRIIIKF
jgi:hypothetical protein